MSEIDKTIKVSPFYSEYRQNEQGWGSVVTNAKQKNVGFAITNELKEPTLSSINDPQTIYFTPQGIMVGGYMVAQPTPWQLIADMRDVLRSSVGAMTYVGSISDTGIIERLTDEVAATINTIELAPYGTFNDVISVARPVTNEVVGSTIDEIQEGFVINNESPNQNKCLLNLGSLLGTLRMVKNDANPKFANFLVSDFQIPANSPITVKLFVMTSERGTYSPAPGVSFKSYTGQTWTIDKFPYRLTQEQLNAICTAKENYYNPDNDDRDNVASEYGVFLLIEGIDRNTTTFQTISNSKFGVMRGITFDKLPYFVDLEQGYVFMSQGSGNLLPNNSDTTVHPGDMILININITKPQTSGDPYHILTTDDFTIIQATTTNIADENTSGLMPADLYTKLMNIDTDANGELLPASFTQRGVVLIGKNGGNASGLFVNNGTLRFSGALGTNASITNGFNITLKDSTSNFEISNVTIPSATSDSYGVVKVDGATITINNGVISSTAQLTWL